MAIAAGVSTNACLFGVPFLVPTLRQETDISLGAAGALVACPSAGLMLTLIAWGAVADRHGERLAMTAGLVLCGGFVAVAATVDGTVAMGAALVLAGAGGGAVNASSGRAVLGWFGLAERGRAMGARQMAPPLGLAFSSAVLPPAGAQWGFGPALMIPAVLSLVCTLAVALLLVDPPRPERSAGQRDGSPYRSVALWRVHGASALLIVPQFSVMTFALVFLVEERSWDAGAAGALLAVVQLGGAGARLLAGYWSDRTGSRLVPMRVLALVNACVMATLVAGMAAESWLAPAAMVAASIITVSGNALAFTSVAELAGHSWAGRAMGAQNTGQNAVGIITAPGVGAVIGAAGYWPAFAVVAAFPVLAAWVVPVRAESRG